MTEKAITHKWFEDYKIYLAIFIILTLVILFLYVRFLPSEDKSIINFITIFGTYSSLYALTITLIQIRSLKSVSEATQDAINVYSRRTEQIVYVSLLAKNIRLIREVKIHLTHNDLMVAIVRLTDIKDFISSLEFSPITLVNRSIILTTLVVDIGNLEDVIHRGKKGVSLRDISQNLETIIDSLFTVENSIKKIEL